MNKYTIYSSVNKTFHFVKSNLPTILSFGAIAGVITTTITAIKAEKRKMEDSYTKSTNPNFELKDLGQYYAVPILLGFFTINCINLSNTINRERLASVIALYTLSKKAYDEYYNKVKERYGIDEHNDILQHIAIEKANDQKIIYARSCLDETKRLFYDEISGRYFESTMSKVIDAEYNLNRNFIIGPFVTLNDFYDFNGIERIPGGNIIGWAFNKDYQWIDFRHEEMDLGDGTIAIVISPAFSPELEQNFFE